MRTRSIKSHIFAVRNFRGNTFSRVFIFANDILKNSAGTYFRVFREWLSFWEFAQNKFSRISPISRGLIFIANFAEQFVLGHFAGTNFLEFCEWCVFWNICGKKISRISRIFPLSRKFLPAKISHPENMRLYDVPLQHVSMVAYRVLQNHRWYNITNNCCDL